MRPGNGRRSGEGKGGSEESLRVDTTSAAAAGVTFFQKRQSKSVFIFEAVPSAPTSPRNLES